MSDVGINEPGESICTLDETSCSAAGGSAHVDMSGQASSGEDAPLFEQKDDFRQRDELQSKAAETSPQNQSVQPIECTEDDIDDIWDEMMAGVG